jgi:hypothetical protein
MELTEKFVIALTLEGRRAHRQTDLSNVIERRFSDAVRIVNRGFGGNSLIVEMRPAIARQLSDALPFATVAPDCEIDLL